MARNQPGSKTPLRRNRPAERGLFGEKKACTWRSRRRPARSRAKGARMRSRQRDAGRNRSCQQLLSKENQILISGQRRHLAPTERLLARKASNELDCAGAAQRPQPHCGRRPPPIRLRRITAATPGIASVPVVLDLAALRRLAVCRRGPGRRNRVNNNRLAHRRWLFGGVALGNGAPNGRGARARSVGRVLSLLGVHGRSGDLAAVVECNVHKWQRVPRLRRLGWPARPSALPLRLGVLSGTWGMCTSGCGPWTPSPGRIGARSPFPSANANPSALAATNPAPYHFSAHF